MRNLFKGVLVVLIALSVHRVIRIYKLLGGVTHYHQHHPGPCKQLEGIQPGSEDFHTLSDGLTFITSGLRYLLMSPRCQGHFKHHGIMGRIYLLDLHNLTRGGVQELKISSTPHFRVDTFAPHGLSIWEDQKTGRHVLFVVNHPFEEGAVDRVEKFVYDPTKQELVHQTSFSDPAMLLVNDIQATGENSFYFTNCNYFRTVGGVLLETLLELPLTNVVYYDGNSYTVVDHGLIGPNGIAMSPDGHFALYTNTDNMHMERKHLITSNAHIDMGVQEAINVTAIYVASTVSHEILVYRRNQNNTLTKIQEYSVYTWPDNIQVDQKTGHLYVACHPIFYQFLAYADDIGAKRAPSQVLHLQVEKGVIMSSQEVLYDHGDLISASSTALVFKGTLLIGSVFDHLVACQVNIPLFH